MVYVFSACLFLSLFSICGAMFGKNTVQYTIDEIQSPLSNPKFCKGQKYLCDPDSLISKDGVAELLKDIEKFHRDYAIKVGVMTIGRMNVTGLETKDASSSALAFAKSVKNKMLLGNLGIMFFISAKDNQFSAVVGSSLSDIISESKLNQIVQAGSSDMKRSYHRSVTKALATINSLFDDVRTRKLLIARRFGAATWFVAFTSLIVFGYLAIMFVNACLIFFLKENSKKKR